MRKEIIEMKTTGAKYIAKVLKSYDVDHVFLVLAILRRTLVEFEREGIKRVVVHSEKSATYMADGYARVTRKPGVAMAQSVGAANLAAGLQDPYLAHSPVIAITGRKEPILQYRNSYQELSLHDRLYDSVTKFDAYVDEVEQLPFLLSRAFREATTIAPRPVHLELKGLSGECVEMAEGTLLHDVETRFKSYPAIRFIPQQEDILTVAKELSEAKRPVVIVGKGVYDSDARKEFTQFIEKFGIPVAAGCDGKGVIPDTHPQYVGVAGNYGSWCANEVIAQADLVIYIGSGVSDQTTLDWTVPGPKTRVVQINIDPSQVCASYSNSIGVTADAKLFLDAMVNQKVGLQDGWKEWMDQARKLVAEYTAAYDDARTSTSLPMKPARLCHELEKVLPADAILVADTGYSAQWTANMVRLNSPDQHYIRAAGSLGWAFPASIGAKAGAPDRPVVCFCGDGALWYHIAELETAKRHGFNVIVVVNNNSAFGQSRVGIQKAYGKDEGNKDEVYSFEHVDFAKIAEDIGCVGIKVEDPKDFGPAMKKALAANAPVVINVVTDPTCVAPAARR